MVRSSGVLIGSSKRREQFISEKRLRRYRVPHTIENRKTIGDRKFHVALYTVLLLSLTATAQDPKAVKTVKVTQSLNDTALYEVKEDGTVLIDWDEVESLAVSRKNPVLTPQAKVMLAIRDGKWKAMNHAK